MFSFLYSEQKKLRRSAENWLEMADRVQKFRRDLLSDPQNQQLLAAAGEVRLRLKERAGPDQLKPAIASLEKALRETGGRIYPTSSMVENVEFFLVASIVILGLRAYFLQPFKIPTNSMWPSYYGMTSEVFQPGQEPGALGKIARLLTLGASNFTLTAPADGEVLIPVFRNGLVAYTERAGRSMGVFPTTLREYTFSVGGTMVRITVPADWAQSEFGFDDAVEKTFFAGRRAALYRVLQTAATQRQPIESSTMQVHSGTQSGEARVYWLPVGQKVRQGDKLLSFDILTGDLLFVDRFSYNFLPPRVGAGFVFKTGNIENLKAEEGDKYFVKRLVGVPGDVLEIKAPLLYRNGQPIEGAAAFGRNARREGKYPGYTNNSGGPTADGVMQASDGLLPPGGTVTVPGHSYFALGDNSPRSKDSRYWGFVPDKDVVGRPLFIYYPVTSRWGPAR